MNDEITDDALVPEHFVLALKASRRAWVAATKAVHPPIAKWTASDKADAERAWVVWFDKEGCKRKY